MQVSNFLKYCRVVLLFPAFAAISAEQCPIQKNKINHGSQTIERVSPQQTATQAQSSPVINASADSFESQNQEWVKIEGNVTIQQSSQTIQTDKAEINDKEGKIKIERPLTIQSETHSASGQQLEADYVTGESEIQQADYILEQPSARGSAESLSTSKEGNIVMTDSTFTTCPVGDDSWMIEAGEIAIDNEKGMGTAEDLVVKIKDIPVFYFPYLSFPTTEARMSGLLMPQGNRSKRHGVDITLPYYFNIAPNYDDTLTTRLIEDRGVHLANEFRYLNDFGDGVLNIEFLDDKKIGYQINQDPDQARIEGYHSRSRYAATWKHQGYYDNGWFLKTDLNQLSDINYIRDFGSDLKVDHTQRIYRRIDLGYQTDWWEFHLMSEDDKVIDTINQPYQRLPELSFSSYKPDAFMSADWRTEGHWVAFEHPTKNDAQRTHFETHLEKNWEKNWFFARPQASFWYTSYKQEVEQQSFLEADVDRLAIGTSLDIGIRFERDIEQGVQTLEPRLFYNRVRAENQTGIGIYDTSLPSLYYQKLFDSNRYSGIDRINEINNLTLGVASEWLIDGESAASLEFGRVFRIDDEQVEFNGTSETLTQHSGYLLDAQYQINQFWDVSTQVELSSHQSDRMIQGHFQIHYQDESGHLFDFRHRLNRQFSQPMEQIEFSSVIPVKDNWKLIAHTRRDLRSNHSIDSFIGFEYETCCWAIQLVQRRYLDAPLSIFGEPISGESLYNSTFSLQFSLKGLGNFGGSRTRALLNNNIYGYQDSFGQ
jgi:LPS-assembly protein